MFARRQNININHQSCGVSALRALIWDNPNMENIKLDERLTELMLEKNISNTQLAGDIDISVSSVQRWKQGSKFMNLTHLMRIVNYFGCSIEYLLCRSDVYIDYMPKHCPNFYKRFRYVMKEKGITRYEMDKNTRIKDSYFTKWQNGTEPHLYSLIEISDYLNISIDYLVGREQ